RKGFSFWAARALWALGEADRVLGRRRPELIAPLRPLIDRTVARFAREIEAGRLVAGSVTAQSEALLGLLALQEAEPSPARAGLAGRAAALLVPRLAGDADHAPWGARTDAPGADWHGWGARATEALATAARVLGRPELAIAARAEADGLWARMLATGDF